MDRPNPPSRSARPAPRSLPVVTRRPRDLVGAAVVLAAVATVAVALDPSVRLAFEAPELRTAFQTAQALIAAMAAYLIFGRVRRRRMLNDLALVFALGLFSVTNLFFAAIPSVGFRDGSLVFEAWAPLVLRFLATVVVAWAALSNDRQMPRTWTRPGVGVVIAVDVIAAVVTLVIALLHTRLPEAVRLVGDTVGAPDLRGHALLRGTLVVMALLLGGAAVGFLRRVERRRDPLLLSLAVGSVFLGFGYACFAVYPSLDTEIVQSGDFLRMAFYLVLLVGAEREIDRYWARLADVVIYEERRRLARDLHDGVAQELAYVVGQTRLLVKGNAPPGTDERVAAAAERALDESRRAITALTTMDDEPLHVAIAHAAEDVAGRVGVEVRVDASPEHEVGPDAREAILRIVREAVSNAGRHGGARNVQVLFGADGVLRIADDGSGFDVAAAGDGRFGLVAMRERAERVGGRFAIESQPGKGTLVEVSLR